MRKQQSLLSLLTASIAVVLFVGLAGCDTPTEETSPSGSQPEDTTVSTVDGTTTDHVCQKADGNCSDVKEDVPPVEEIVTPSQGCETLPWLKARPDAKKVECTNAAWGSSDICELEILEDDGTCMVRCPPTINQIPATMLKSDELGFSFDAGGALIECVLL